ncbi:MAG: DEAD/DEAH box helicase [Alphaproteobacteria bacterium]
MLDIILTSERIQTHPEGRQFLTFIQGNETELGLEGSVVYYDFPAYSDYESVLHKPDFLVISPKKGLLAIKFIAGTLFNQTERPLLEIDESISEFTSIVVGRLLKSKRLRSGRTTLKFEVLPILYAPAAEVKEIQKEIESELVTSETTFKELVLQHEHEQVSAEDFSEIRSIVEGAKALTRPQRRILQDPKTESKAAALIKLEEEIANFDEKQRQTALSTVQGPQRIRGLAGSGKTVILAMKAAHLHINNPHARILVTFYTKSLRSTLEYLITRFYRHYKEEDPDWNLLNIRHGWGGKDIPGVYSEACKRHEKMPMRFGEARQKSTNPFDYICKELIKQVQIQPYYDYILVDEGQDFPSGFYELLFFMAKGERDQKNIVWAYDELQNILNVNIRSPEALFGLDLDGEPKISLERSETQDIENDIVLSKCYRNQREVLVTAHALGFGLYGDIVQMLEGKEHWTDVGYQVLSDALTIGNKVEILRPEENSPLAIQDDDKIIACHSAKNLDGEIAWVSQEIMQFLSQGLKPEDILVIALDDRHARTYLQAVSEKLASQQVSTNNIIEDPYNEPPFKIEGRVSLSTVYRAKGNEAYVVFTVGVDAINGRWRNDRNKLFTAFTRSKAWLRVSGIGDKANKFIAEITAAKENFPHLKFTMPDPDEVETIQRDLSQKHIAAKRLQEEYKTKMKRLGINDDEIENYL